MLSGKEIIKLCEENLPNFKKIINQMTYEPKGIFNSEMLLFITLVNYFGVKLIIESGRANGHSTNIIAEYFKNSKIKIYSVEYNKYSSDVKHSFNKLKNYQNLKMLFGNSFDIIPKLVTEDCCILIDGPKHLYGIKLAIELLKNPKVKVVCLHDLLNDSPHRKDAESIFNNHFFTDNKIFVDKFKFLDRKCWLDQRKFKEFKSWAPYKRGKYKMKSYASTLLAIINSKNSYNIKEYKKRCENMKNLKRKWSLKMILDEWPNRLKLYLKFPILYIYYEKRINHKKHLDFIDLMRQWKIFVGDSLLNLFKKKVLIYRKLEGI